MRVIVTQQWRKFNAAVLSMELILMLMEIVLGLCFDDASLEVSPILLICRCFPHIINIAAQTVAKELKENPFMVVSGLESDPNRIEYLENYETALRADPIGGARGIVAALRSSGQR
jgi:hypothetical protein